MNKCLLHQRKPNHSIENGWPREISRGVDMRLEGGDSREGESPSKMQGALGSCSSSLIAVEMSELPDETPSRFSFSKVSSWSVVSLLIAISILIGL